MSPTPDGSPLTIKVRCWTSKAPRAPFTKHTATLHADWSVEVPHDLEAERLAQAFGGWLSCLELETSTIPAARAWLDLTLRNVPPPLHLTPAGRWVARYQQGCCPTTGFAAVGDAFEHLRSLNHLALQKKVDRKQLGDLVKVLGAAHGVDKVATIPDDVAELAAQGLTCGRADVGRLWHAGVHPQYVLDIRENLGLTMRLPMSFYLAVLLRKPDLDWMRTTIDRAGPLEEPVQFTEGGVVLDGSGLMSLPEWLAWTAADWDAADPTARSRWLDRGISRQVLMSLAGRGYTPEDIDVLAAGIGRSADGAARYLVSWLVCDVRPDVADLIELHSSGRAPLWHTPSPVALLRVLEVLGERPSSKRSIDRLGIALLLAVCGTVPDTVAAYRAGRTWRDEPLFEEHTA